MKLLCQSRAAKFDERSPPRFFRRHSDAQVVFDVHGQMAFLLFGEFTFTPFAIEHVEDPDQPAA